MIWESDGPVVCILLFREQESDDDSDDEMKATSGSVDVFILFRFICYKLFLGCDDGDSR